MVEDGEDTRDDGEGTTAADVESDAWGSTPNEVSTERGRETPRETVGDLENEDLTDLDEVEGLTIESPDAPIEAGSIDRENAVFVILGVVLSVLVFLEFLSVLPAG